jgi:uncharacterized protein YdeI (YjbR/CyaY-like superfamily)
VKPRFFATPAAFRAWLEEHHTRSAELVVGFYKKGSGKPSITWPESVDAALCFGWIDGIRRRVDELSYTIRFTPRKPASIWSAVNIKRVQELTKQGLMQPAGLQAFERRDEAKSAIYAYEQRNSAVFPDSFEKQFRANKSAWDFFQSQPPWYRRTVTHWVISAKKEETRLRRLTTLIEDSAHHRTIRQLTRPG